MSEHHHLLNIVVVEIEAILDNTIERFKRCLIATKHAYTAENVASSPSRYDRQELIVMKRVSIAATPFQYNGSVRSCLSLSDISMSRSELRISLGSAAHAALTTLARCAAKTTVPHQVFVKRISTYVFLYFSRHSLSNNCRRRCKDFNVFTMNSICLRTRLTEGKSFIRSIQRLWMA